MHQVSDIVVGLGDLHAKEDSVLKIVRVLTIGRRVTIVHFSLV